MRDLGRLNCVCRDTRTRLLRADAALWRAAAHSHLPLIHPSLGGADVAGIQAALRRNQRVQRNVAAGRPRDRRPRDAVGAACCAVFSPSRDTFIAFRCTRGAERALYLFSSANGRLLRTYPEAFDEPQRELVFDNLTFSPDGESFIFLTHIHREDNTVPEKLRWHVQNVASGQLRTHQCSQYPNVVGTYLSPGGHYLAAETTGNGQTDLWQFIVHDLHTDSQVQGIPVISSCDEVGWSACGKLLSCTYSNPDGGGEDEDSDDDDDGFRFGVINMSTKEVIPLRGCCDLTFAPDSQHVACCHVDKGLNLHCLGEGLSKTWVPAIPDKGVFSADSTKFADFNIISKRILVCCAHTGAVLCRIRTDVSHGLIGFSPDGSVLATYADRDYRAIFFTKVTGRLGTALAKVDMKAPIPSSFGGVTSHGLGWTHDAVLLALSYEEISPFGDARWKGGVRIVSFAPM